MSTRLTGGFQIAVDSVALSADGRYGLLGGIPDDDPVIPGPGLQLWNLQAEQKMASFREHRGGPRSSAFSPDGRYVVTGDHDGELRLWDVTCARLVRRLGGRWFGRHRKGVNDVAFSPDGRHLLSAGDDDTVRLWDVSTGSEVRRLVGSTEGYSVWRGRWQMSGVLTVALSPDGCHALSGGCDGTIRRWDVETGKEKHRFRLGQAEDLLFASDGRRALACSVARRLEPPKVQIHQLDLEKNIHEGSSVYNAESSQCLVKLLSGGQRVLVCDGDVIDLVDVESEKRILRLGAQQGSLTSVAVSADGRVALTAGCDNTVWLHQLPDKSSPSARAKTRTKGDPAANAGSLEFHCHCCGKEGEPLHASEKVKVVLTTPETFAGMLVRCQCCENLFCRECCQREIGGGASILDRCPQCAGPLGSV